MEQAYQPLTLNHQYFSLFSLLISLTLWPYFNNLF
jgi:hypothetical protein